MQEELSGVTPSETIVSVAPVRAGPHCIVLSADGTPLSPEQKQASRFANFYHDWTDDPRNINGDDGLSREAFNARIPPEKGGFLRM